MLSPRVIIATTNRKMAKLLRGRLYKKCLSLDLSLLICPISTTDDSRDNIDPYNNTKDFFDYLEALNPVIVANCLVVLDLGTELESAFLPPSNSLNMSGETQSWKKGIAVELLLRFPQIFTVFLSPEIPHCNLFSQVENEDISHKIIIDILSNEDDNSWKSFRSVINTITYNDDYHSKKLIQTLLSFTSLHFVSPSSYETNLYFTLEKFSQGMRCWFDPTGLRTLVKNYFLGVVFGSEQSWESTKDQRTLIKQRLNNAAIVIDEEKEFGIFSAYSAWKYGRRTWLVTTYCDFNQSPLWTKNHEHADSVIILRDIDLRFPDIPTNLVGVREKLKDIYSNCWKDKIASHWHVCVVSGEAKIEQFDVSEPRLGQSLDEVKIKYFGFNKPLATVYDLQGILGIGHPSQLFSTVAEINSVSMDGEKKGHSAPYTNLRMAEFLLEQSGRCAGASSHYLIGALLASEAYELLLGMSKTTAIRALHAMHELEVKAEVLYPSVSHTCRIKERNKDIHKTVRSLFDNNNSNNHNNIFLSKFWLRLRPIYRTGERFEAAESANLESLALQKWFWSPFRDGKYSYWIKKILLKVGTSLVWWAGASVLLSLIWSVWFAYLADYQFAFTIEGGETFFKVFHQVILESLGRPGVNEIINIKELLIKKGSYMYIVTGLQATSTYIMYGLLVAMLFRKLVRD